MPKNITIDIIERIDKLEKAQAELAAAKVAELAEQGIIVTEEEVTKSAVTDKVTREVPTGVCNGVNKLFILANTPIAGTEEVYLCGVLLNPGVAKDYTFAGTQIILNYAPDTGDDVKVSYEYIVAVV
jgi:hypothetical protein